MLRKKNFEIKIKDIKWFLPTVYLLSTFILLIIFEKSIDRLFGEFFRDIISFVISENEEILVNNLANNGEIVPAIIAIALTVIAIVVELVANKYSPKIVDLFIDDRKNNLIIGFFVVLANASSQSISQSIVPIELQGRVFSAMRFISSSAMVVSMAISGPLVDKVLYRYFVGENLLTHIFGVGKSASMGFLITVAGIIVVVAAIVGSMNPLVLSVEDIRAEEDKEMVRV